MLATSRRTSAPVQLSGSMCDTPQNERRRVTGIGRASTQARVARSRPRELANKDDVGFSIDSRSATFKEADTVSRLALGYERPGLATNQDGVGSGKSGTDNAAL